MAPATAVVVNLLGPPALRTQHQAIVAVGTHLHQTQPGLCVLTTSTPTTTPPPKSICTLSTSPTCGKLLLHLHQNLLFQALTQTSPATAPIAPTIPTTLRDSLHRTWMAIKGDSTP
mmetsp:Transcript_31958/g.62465  ORF Transcript_31958/g.62465 Transcript_31958/m.62465 type:complete len:116 (+) Transcript_31958:2187-2534(+)